MTATKDKMKQRSFYMDDETYALIERHAEKLGASNGTALRMIVRSALLDAPAELGYLERLRGQQVEMAADGQREGDGAHAIVLPPDKQETFKVPERFKEKGPRAPRAQHVDDDF